MSTSPTQYMNGAPTRAAGFPRANAEPAGEDAAALRTMQSRLHAYISLAQRLPAPLPWTVSIPEPDGRQHRLVLLNSVAVSEGDGFPFVGFFGHKRPSADAHLLDALDAELIQELRNEPQMVSYSSLELRSGSWGNLVVMRSAQGALDWVSSARHAFAAHTVAPACYVTIRLHSGVMTLSGATEATLRIHRTKHFDYAWGNC